MKNTLILAAALLFSLALQGQKPNTLSAEEKVYGLIDGKAIVTRVNESKKNEIPIGSEIIEVNGLDTKTHIYKNVMPYIASSTDYIRYNESVYSLLKGYKGDIFNIKIKKPDNEIIALQLEHQRTEEKEVYPPFENLNLLNFKKMENGTGYLSLNSFEDARIDSLFQLTLPELYKVNWQHRPALSF